MNGTDAKKSILARRAKFIAAAVASATIVACGKEEKPVPQPCLSVALDFDAGHPAPPPPPPPPIESSPPPNVDVAVDAGSPDAGPKRVPPKPIPTNRPMKVGLL